MNTTTSTLLTALFYYFIVAHVIIVNTEASSSGTRGDGDVLFVESNNKVDDQLLQQVTQTKNNNNLRNNRSASTTAGGINDAIDTISSNSSSSSSITMASTKVSYTIPRPIQDDHRRQLQQNNPTTTTSTSTAATSTIIGTTTELVLGLLFTYDITPLLVFPDNEQIDEVIRLSENWVETNILEERGEYANIKSVSIQPGKTGIRWVTAEQIEIKTALTIIFDNNNIFGSPELSEIYSLFNTGHSDVTVFIQNYLWTMPSDTDNPFYNTYQVYVRAHDEVPELPLPGQQVQLPTSAAATATTATTAGASSSSSSASTATTAATNTDTGVTGEIGIQGRLGLGYSPGYEQSNNPSSTEVLQVQNWFQNFIISNMQTDYGSMEYISSEVTINQTSIVRNDTSLHDDTMIWNVIIDHEFNPSSTNIPTPQVLYSYMKTINLGNMVVNNFWNDETGYWYSIGQISWKH